MEKTLQFPEVPIENLRWRCDPGSLGFESTDECPYSEDIFGQERAIKALKMGLKIKSHGYNIFACGRSGTGKTSTIMSIVNQMDLSGRIPDDVCYVNNFKNPDMPKVLTFPAGSGKKFQADMAEMVVFLKKSLPYIFESEAYKKESQEILEKARARENRLVKAFNERVTKENFQLVQYQIGPMTQQDIVPLLQGQPVPLEQLETLSEQDKFSREELEAIRTKMIELKVELDSVMKEARQIEREARDANEKLEYKTALPAVNGRISDIQGKYGQNNEKITRHLDDVRENILSNLKNFRSASEDQNQAQAMPFPFAQPQAPSFLEYEVNLVVDNSETRQRPVIYESDPSFKNLFGTIEREMDRTGLARTDFTKIKAGSILRANGGFIVFNALDALTEPGVWMNLKKTLKNMSLNLQPYDPYGFLSTALKPEAVDLDVKVVMIGDAYLYNQLYNMTEEFRKIFKTKADFAVEMPNQESHLKDYVCFLKKTIADEKLLPFDKKAASIVIEYGARLTGNQRKLSTRFIDIADLIRESHFWAQEEGASMVTDRHVEKAQEEKIQRVSMLDDRLKDMIHEGTIMIDTEKRVVGQVNGLSVYDTGDHIFGKPSKITAETAIGRAGVINIEREANLSGSTHNKGVLIMGGYFNGKYAQDKPLTMSASIAFEQSYGGIDGDSASSTEVYAILSSLSGVPIRQDIAVTGSVNQKGEIQPIGGANFKIEGFYDICKARGLTGGHGVMIPDLNVPDLMLRKDIIEAVSEGKFHIYPVKTIDQGISILTGIAAGEKDAEGNYPQGTINDLVNERLKAIGASLKSSVTEENKNSAA